MNKIHKIKNIKIIGDKLMITFYNVIDSINKNGILLDFEHPNRKKYPNQKILVINIDIKYLIGKDE
ncbi:hypothetical protein HY745_12375 [Candidatus Desantisbacteria bacterium]|nr:hypothetical protein [Candidatus Desantisbacteria bacterium]